MPAAHLPEFHRESLSIASGFLKNKQIWPAANCMRIYWSQLARTGHEVVQFKEVVTGRFIAVDVDGVAKEHARCQQPPKAWKSA